MRRKSVPRADELRVSSTPQGLTAPEVLVVLVIIGFIVLFVFMGVTRQRETARFAGCQRNLMQIGVGLALYDQSTGHLPAVPVLPVGDRVHAGSPLAQLLQELALPNLTGLSDPKRPPARQPGLTLVEQRIPGFTCGSDQNANSGLHRAPISYRATTGDAPDGGNGVFAPGRTITLVEVEARDGSSYTAAFSERLVGDGQGRSPALMNYAQVPGPLAPTGCPPADPIAWRGDAGESWWIADWQSTLYNHALAPNGSPSCLATDGRTALMGASSGHVRGVNVLFLDGSVRTVTPRVNAKVWREWANISTPAPEPAKK